MPAPEEALPGRSEPAFEVPERHAVLGTPLKPPFPEGIETAYFALGCFWGAERLFWALDGVYTTAVGYMNGTTPNPTYEEVCSGRTGHAEAVLVAFDPQRISYADLLKVFFEEHDPTQGMRQGNDVGTQYRSGIYFANDAQKATAEMALRGLRRGAARRRPRADHDRGRAGRALLLRRGLPPAVPAQGAERLLRPGRHRRLLSHPRRRLLALPRPTRRIASRAGDPFLRLLHRRLPRGDRHRLRGRPRRLLAAALDRARVLRRARPPRRRDDRRRPAARLARAARLAQHPHGRLDHRLLHRHRPAGGAGSAGRWPAATGGRWRRPRCRRSPC